MSDLLTFVAPWQMITGVAMLALIFIAAFIWNY